MSENNKKICIDFDGVIHDFKNPVEGRRMGAPIAGTLEALQELQAVGYQIIVWSVRGDLAGIEYLTEWLNFYNIPFDEITNKKPNADYYVDDKGIRFTSWAETMTLIGLLDGAKENNV